MGEWFMLVIASVWGEWMCQPLMSGSNQMPVAKEGEQCVCNLTKQQTAFVLRYIYLYG